MGSVPEGAHVQIAMASMDEILGGAQSSVKTAMDKFPSSATLQGALVSSCAVRYILLGTRTGSELDLIREGLGQEVPISGFYAFGEIAPLKDDARPSFHNETCCTVLMGT